MKVGEGNEDLEARMPVCHIRWCAAPLALYRARCGNGDALLGTASINWLKLILTYCVPYAVCTYGAVSHQLRMAEPPLEPHA